MDNIDLKILDILQSDGRITMKELGQRVGLTSPATIERVKKLEEAGTICGYKAIVNIAKAGLPVRVLIMVTLEGNTGADLVTFVRQHDNLLSCHRLAGNASFLIDAALPDLGALERLLEEIMAYGRAETHVVLSSPVEHKAVVLP